MKLPAIKTQVIIFLTSLAGFLAVKDKEPAFLLAILLAVGSCVIIESLAIYLKEKRFAVTGSSIISGLIIGYVICCDSPWWMLLFACLFAMGSKHLVRFNKRHIFNPAAFGIFAAIILLGAQTQWKAAYLWFIMAPFGVYFTLKIRKFEIITGYFLTTLSLFGVQAFIQGVPLMNIFYYLNYFYIFIMVIEPRTTPIKSKAKLLFGILVAIMIFILTEAGIRFDAELFSLLTLNALVPLLSKIPERSQK